MIIYSVEHSVTGRANVGKSTILNAVLGQKDLLSTSKKAVSMILNLLIFVSHWCLALHSRGIRKV